MNNKATRMWSRLKRWSACAALALCSLPGFAQQADPCDADAIKAAFSAYFQRATPAQVTAIQDKLNTLGYGPLDSDSVLGAETRSALQQFCQASDLPEATDDLAGILIELLAQATPPDATPAAPQAEAAPETVAPKSEPNEPVQTTATPGDTVQPSVTDDGVMVYYRWSAPEASDDEGGDDATTQPQTADTTLPDDVMKPLADMEGVAYPNAMLFKYALADLYADSGVDYKTYLDEILKQARVEPDAKLNPIQLSGNGCGCSRDFSSLVYGFYPAWLADGAAPQTVDFSIFDRIGFYALTLDAAGNIQNPLQWSDAWNVAAFINTAHKYRVAVDVTVQAEGWQSWDAKLLKRAARSIAASVTERFTPDDTGLLDDPLAVLEASATAQGDGVTLMFDDYTDSIETRANIISLVNELHQQLADRARSYPINILLDVDVTALDEQTAFRDLEAILLAGNDSPAPVANLFLFLQQPTTDAKKILRRNIEDEFRGAERKAVLRKIVPIISPHGHFNDPRGAFAQFSDDLIYFQDNFAGVGLWPLPLAGDESAETVTDKLVQLYSADGDGDHLGALVDEYLPELCQFACPNRWLFRIGFDVLLGVLVLYGLAAFWVCRLRTLYKQYFPYFFATVAATVLVFVVSLVCDPYWQARADGVMAGLLLLIAGGVIGRYVYKATRPPLP